MPFSNRRKAQLFYLLPLLHVCARAVGTRSFWEPCLRHLKLVCPNQGPYCGWAKSFSPHANGSMVETITFVGTIIPGILLGAGFGPSTVPGGYSDGKTRRPAKAKWRKRHRWRSRKDNGGTVQLSDVAAGLRFGLGVRFGLHVSTWMCKLQTLLKLCWNPTSYRFQGWDPKVWSRGHTPFT